MQSDFFCSLSPNSLSRIRKIAFGQTEIIVIKVHAVAFAVAEETALGTSPLFRPRTITEQLKPVLPNFPKIIAVYIPLVKIRPDTGTGRNRTVYTYRCHGNAGVALEQIIAGSPLVSAEKSLTRHIDLDSSGFSQSCNPIEHLPILHLCNLQLRILRSSSGREDGPDTPPLHADRDQIIGKVLQTSHVVLIDACHNIPHQFRCALEQTDGLQRPLKTSRISTQPVMLLLKPVETHRNTAHTRANQCRKTLLCKQHAVGNHAPRETSTTHFPTARFQIFSHQRFPSGKNHHTPVRIHLILYAVQDFQKILQGHVGMYVFRPAITSTMLA